MAAVSERMDKKLKPGQRQPRRTLACDKANRHGCGSNTVKADYVEQIVIDYVLAALEHTDVATARARRAGGDAHQLVASIETDEQFLADLATDYGAQRINRTQFLAAQDPVRARLLLARRRLEQLTIDPSLDGAAFEGDSRQLGTPRPGPATRPRRPVRRARRDQKGQAGSLLRPQPSPTGAGRGRRLMSERPPRAAQPSPPSTANHGGGRI
jgi:hypothetical protein